MDFVAGVGQVVLSGRDHERISGAVKSTQAEVVVKVSGVVNREAELKGRIRLALVKHNKPELLQIAFNAQLCEGK